MRRITAAAFIVFATVSLAAAERPADRASVVRFAIEALPSAQIPVGALGGIVRPTAGFALDMEVMLAALPWLSAGICFGYAPAVVAGNDWLHTMLGGGTAQVAFPVASFLEIGAAVGSGYEYSALVSDDQVRYGGGTYLEFRATARYILLERLRIGIFAGYRHLFGITGTIQIGATAKLILGK